MCGSDEVVCLLSLLIRGAQHARCQAETPLIALFRFSRPALPSPIRRGPPCASGEGPFVRGGNGSLVRRIFLAVPDCNRTKTATDGEVIAKRRVLIVVASRPVSPQLTDCRRRRPLHLEHVVRFYWTAEPFEIQLAHGLQFKHPFNGCVHLRVDQNLAVERMIA